MRGSIITAIVFMAVTGFASEPSGIVSSATGINLLNPRSFVPQRIVIQESNPCVFELKSASSSIILSSTEIITIAKQRDAAKQEAQAWKQQFDKTNIRLHQEMEEKNFILITLTKLIFSPDIEEIKNTIRLITIKVQENN